MTLVRSALRRRDFDDVGRGRRHHQVALHGEGADRVAGRERTAVDGGVADDAVAADGAAGVDGEGGVDDRAVHRQRAAVDRGRTWIGIVAGQDQRAHPGLAQRAGAGNVGGEGERVGEVRDDLAFVVDRRRVDRAGETAGSEIERAALGDAGEAGRVDHAAVGNGERSDQGPQPQLVSPTTSEVRAFRTEPAPVTVSIEVPVGSPTPRGPVALTTPPLEMVSIPGPAERAAAADRQRRRHSRSSRSRSRSPSA